MEPAVAEIREQRTEIIGLAADDRGHGPLLGPDGTRFALPDRIDPS